MVWAALAIAAAIIVVVGVELTAPSGTSRRPTAFTQALDPGTSLTGAAPDFTLTDQSGQPVSLSSYRGRAVVLAFNDSECTTVCPLATSAMVAAQRMLGPAGAKMALLGVNANPSATSIADVRRYTELHGMTQSWRFLTGSLTQLHRVWHSYHIDVAVEHDQIDHTPALFVIDPAGRLDKVYLTQVAYSSVEQQARLLADEVSRVLPDHPRVHSTVSFAQIPTIAPTSATSLPQAEGGTVPIGPGHGARLYAFFATWDRQVTNLGDQLRALNRYQSAAARRGLPALTAIDEASVEPSSAALPQFLGSLGRPLAYPVGVDASGRVADGYGVQDEPWFVLISSTGRVLWYYDIATSGWLSESALEHHVRAALARQQAPPSAASAQASLAGSPPVLAALHAQAGKLLGGRSALAGRLRALRGYPVVINAWASWCTPCRAEFGLFAVASAKFGKTVAFLGANANDSAGDASAFLSQHAVSYPSYETSTSALGSLAVVQGLPTTIFVSRQGKVAFVHTGQYASQGSLDDDISTYALGG